MNGDLISREAAIDEIRDIWCCDCHCATNKRDCKACNAGDCIDALRDLPAVDATPVVHGRWKYFHKQNRAVCTVCSFERDLDANFGKAVSCPNCGAKMDLEE